VKNIVFLRRQLPFGLPFFYALSVNLKKEKKKMLCRNRNEGIAAKAAL